MKKILLGLVNLFVAATLIFGGYILRSYSPLEEKEVHQLSGDNMDDLKLPGETEIRVVTIEQVETELFEVKEFVSYSAESYVEKEVEDYRGILEYEIKSTKNSIHMTGTVIVKIGYDINECVIKVDNDSKKIYISLPDQKATCYLDWDTVKCDEDDNIRNPIKFEQYYQLINEIEELGLNNAYEEGINEKAEENIQLFIINILESNFGYEVIFM